MLELLAYLAITGPNIYDNTTKEYQILDLIDYNQYEWIEEYLKDVGYKFFYEPSSDCWVVMEDIDLIE